MDNYETTSKKNEHMGNLDVLRCLAALAVVCIHVVSAPVHSFDGELHSNISQILETIHNLMNWAVPVFFILTGYFCGKHEMYSYPLTLKKVKKFVFVLFTIGFFYALLECVFTTEHITIVEIGTALLNVLNRDLWDHMWFVYDVIGIYLVLPLLFMFFSKSHEQWMLVFFLFLFRILLPWIGKNSVVNIDINFPLGTNLFYVCFGMLFSTGSLDRINRRIRILISILLILLGVLVPLFGFKQSGYSDLFVCFLATGLFVLFLELYIPATEVMTKLTGCTWGVYLIHPFFINLAIKCFNIDLLSGTVVGKMVVFYLIIIFVSFLSVYVLKHIPIIKSLF